MLAVFQVVSGHIELADLLDSTDANQRSCRKIQEEERVQLLAGSGDMGTDVTNRISISWQITEFCDYFVTHYCGCNCYEVLLLWNPAQNAFLVLPFNT